jgi:DNA-binding beta-propeller fold protein YncE
MKNTFIIAARAKLILCFFVWGCVCGILVADGSAFSEVNFVGEISEHLIKPVDAVVSPDEDIYVLDQSQSKVFVFNAKGQLKLSFGTKGSLAGQLYHPTSIAFNQEQEVIVVDGGNARVNIYNQKGHFLSQLGNEGRHKGEFEKPVSVAVDGNDYIYVADQHLDKIVQYSPQGVFLNEIKLDYEPTDLAFGPQNAMFVLSQKEGIIRKYQGESLSQEMIFVQGETNLLKQATGLSVDEANHIYIISLHDHSIYKFNESEELLFSFGSRGEGRGQFQRPDAIIYTLGKIYIPDTHNQRIQILQVSQETQPAKLTTSSQSRVPLVEYEDSIYVSKYIRDLKVLKDNALYALSDSKGCIFQSTDERKVLGVNVNDVSGLSMPQAFELKSTGEALVADTDNHRVQFLNGDGSYGYQFGVKGNDQSQFNHLEGIALHKEGYIYVADTRNDRIQIFNRDGIYLDSFGERSQPADEKGPAPGTFREPKALEFNSQNELFVLDYRNQRIQVFDEKGKFLDQISSLDAEVGFQDPVDLSIDENDYIYVADQGDHSIKIFDPDLQFVGKFGSEGKGPSYFPRLSAVDSLNNKIYVADYTVDDIKVFSFNRGPIQEVVTPKKEQDDQDRQQAEAPKQEPVQVSERWENPDERKQVSKKEMEPKGDENKLFLSRLTYALGYINLPYEAKLMMLKKDLEQNGMVPLDVLDQLVIESEREVSDGVVRIIVSVPKKQ